MKNWVAFLSFKHLRLDFNQMFRNIVMFQTISKNLKKIKFMSFRFLLFLFREMFKEVIIS